MTDEEIENAKGGTLALPAYGFVYLKQVQE
jgi:hypothetical protein